MQSSLEDKQAYLRNNIDQDQYEDFYQYCEKEIGSVDIYSWTLEDVAKIVTRFKEFAKQQQMNDAHEAHERSYFDYQSAPGEEDKPTNHNQILNHIEQQQQPSECQTSRVVKTSAVDLLDQAFQSSTVKKNNTSLQSPKNNNSSAVSFDQFDFWTSTLTNSQVIKTEEKVKEEPVRLKSATLYENKQKPSDFAPKYDQKYSQNRNRHSTQTNMGMNSMGGGIDLMHVPKPQQPQKKTSPYLKKQKMSQPMQAKKPHEIKLKSVNPLAVQKGNNGQKWLVEQKIFDEVVNCYKSAVRSQLSDKSLKISIQKYDIIERSFLAADYAMYHLKISPLNLECKRNYDDFSKLKTNLQKFFPGHHLPYLDDNSWFSNTNQDFINNQKKMLQFFLRDLIRNKQLRNSRVLEEFLMIKDHKPMKRKFQKYDKMDKLKGIEQLCVLQGRVQATLSNQQKNYNDNMKRFVDKMDSHFDRFTRLTENVSKSYNDLMSSFKALSALTAEMEKQVKSFNTKVTTNEIKNLGAVFRVLRETWKQEFSNAKFQHEIYTKKIIPFIRYEHANFHELNKLIDLNHKFQKAFQKRSQIQTINIRDEYYSQDNKGAKRGILDESKSLLVLKYQTGYLGRQLRTESQRVFDQMGVKIFNRWQMISECYLDKLLKNMEYMKNLAKIDPDRFNTDVTY